MADNERQFIVWILAVVAYLVFRFTEYRRHRDNLAFLEAAGCEEDWRGLALTFHGMTWMPLFIAPIEALFHFEPRSRLTMAACLAALAFSAALRFWSIHSLGRLWSKRCVWLAGIPKESPGPAKYLKNPEYYTRLIDAFCLAWLIGASFSAWASVAILAIMGRWLTNVENRFIDRVNGLQQKGSLALGEG